MLNKEFLFPFLPTWAIKNTFQRLDRVTEVGVVVDGGRKSINRNSSRSLSRYIDNLIASIQKLCE